ncbi:MAG: class I SAM-dependent methyltransferase [Candidatus Sumerlaeia bacterium]|nr:class I SAM-dependent methyltransferase [Candidatus Sumerlaeia bacterium]
MTDRIEREKAFHDSRFGEGDKLRAPVQKYYAIMDRNRAHYQRLVLEHAKGADLLEYGCGSGSYSKFWAEAGAHVTGIDISTEGIKTAREEAAQRGLDIRFEEMNAEALAFSDQSFDIVVGTGILHHLDLDKAYPELARVLRPDGFAVFIEPLGHNPAINLYRRLTPAMRTDDEHPLMMADLRLARRYFGEVDISYFNLFTLAAVPFRRFGIFGPLVGALHAVDKGLLAVLPFMRRYAWTVVMRMS